MLALLKKLYHEHVLPYEELVYVIRNMDDRFRPVLFEYANRVREQVYGKRVFMRGLIEFSNICRRNCLYCGIRSANRKVERYRLTPEEIMACCEEGYRLGFRTFVLQSGEDEWFTKERMADIIRGIKETFPDAAITLSMGERDRDTYQAWFDAGAERYLLRHETASSRLYAALHPGSSLVRRVECLHMLKEIGYQVGAGFMVGLPEQRPEDLALDLIFLHKFQPHMIGIGPFIPHKDTPLGTASAGTVEDTLVMVALARLLVPKANIPATTAVGSLDPMGREKALRAGANVVMPNLSPVSVRSKYTLYDGKICTGDEAAQCRHCLEMRIASAGYEVDMGRGDSALPVSRSASA